MMEKKQLIKIEESRRHQNHTEQFYEVDIVLLCITSKILSAFTTI